MPSVKKGGLKKTFNFPPLKAGSSPDKVLSGATRTMAGGKAQTPASSSRKRNLNATEASKSKGGNKKPCRTNGDSSGGNQEQATNSLPGSSKQPSQQNNLLGGAVTINAGYERDRMPPGSRTRPRGQRNNLYCNLIPPLHWIIPPVHIQFHVCKNLSHLIQLSQDHCNHYYTRLQPVRPSRIKTLSFCTAWFIV
jgi:hypothetical protein